MERVFAFPRMGDDYTQILCKWVRELGFKIIEPGRIDEDTVKYGVRNSPDMICYPFKTSMGNLKKSLDKGANTVLFFDTGGICRFRQYWKLQHTILHDNGYSYEVFPFGIDIYWQFKKAKPDLSLFKFYKTTKKYWKYLRAVDADNKIIPGQVNVGIIGEIYTVMEEGVNYNLKNKIIKYGANPYTGTTLSGFLIEVIKRKVGLRHMRKYHKRAHSYMNGEIGGHGVENIRDLLYMIDNGISGVVHILPMSCMPETTVEPVINKVCYENSIPLLRISIDETNSEANINTRIETFVELLKRQKR